MLENLEPTRVSERFGNPLELLGIHEGQTPRLYDT